MMPPSQVESPRQAVAAAADGEERLMIGRHAKGLDDVVAIAGTNDRCWPPVGQTIPDAAKLIIVMAASCNGFAIETGIQKVVADRSCHPTASLASLSSTEIHRMTGL